MLTGKCPQCDKEEGNNSSAGQAQTWTEPTPCCQGMPAEMQHLVPHITKGLTCQHTISLNNWKEHNNV